MHTALLAWSAYRHSPVLSEVPHLPAGISHWRFGRFDLYRVNPPLVRMVAAVPVMLADPAVDWGSYDSDPLTRSEGRVAIDFVQVNGFRTFWLFTLGRWACIPFSLIGACVCYLWARDLYGVPSGLVAMALWCFCPNILGNAALVMPDAPAAAMGAAACYLFWRWLRQPTWWRVLAAGAVLGLAELTKSTLLVLYPLWPLMWIAFRRPDGREQTARAWLRGAAMLLVQVLVSLNLLNLGYGFEGTLQPLRDYRFRSHALTGAEASEFAAGNRFADSWAGAIPIPLPRDYVQGIDAQKVDFERGQPSYLRGEWSDHGWWYFYLYGLAIKVPLGTWLLAALAAAAPLWLRQKTATWRDELCVLLPAVGIVALVSSQTGFSIHFRYVLPAFAFFFVWASKAALAFSSSRRFMAAMTTSALAWSIGSSLWYYPHSLSYFNELVGGPEHGHEHLLDSSIAWGQDLLYLKDWYEAHPEARPFYFLGYGCVRPQMVGFAFEEPPQRTKAHLPLEAWYAIDVFYLHARNILPVKDLHVVGSAGYSIRVYGRHAGGRRGRQSSVAPPLCGKLLTSPESGVERASLGSGLSSSGPEKKRG